MLKRILINLLNNAIKFTPAHGTVIVEAGVTAAGCLELAVRDNGIGISAEQLTHVLQPFGQGESGLTRRYEGAWLGLPLVRAMVELHQGLLRLESAVGTGTVATVSFPPRRAVWQRPRAVAS
ncbi:MAG: hypothetical protein FJX56_10560 [Alphaproteobacteria bacterium]|nr:hypothetical protein [Alphaproteobacteria bacterium]